MTVALAAVPTRGRGRPSNADLVDENRTLRAYNEELVAELRILREELGIVGRFLTALGTVLEQGYNADRPDVVQHVRSRIDSVGRTCIRRGSAS